MSCRTLLEQEESRLNISDTSGLSARSSSILSSGSRKRKRSQAMETEGQEEIQCVYQNIGPLKIAEHDVRHGHFVTLENSSSEDISLGGCKIVHRSNDIEVRDALKYICKKLFVQVCVI